MGVEEAGLYAALYGVVSRPFLMAGGMFEAWMRPIYYEAVATQDADREKRMLHLWMGAVVCAAIAGIGMFQVAAVAVNGSPNGRCVNCSSTSATTTVLKEITRNTPITAVD